MSAFKKFIGQQEVFSPVDTFIHTYDYSRNEWFMEYCEDLANQQRIAQVIDMKEYLAGNHDINRVRGDQVKGQDFQSRRIILQYAKKLIDFSASYLIGNKVTLSGNDRVMEEIRKIYRTSDYDKKDFDLAQGVLRYGNMYEYVYIKNDKNRKISSKLIDPADAYPVYNEDGEYIAFIEHYTINNISFWNVYTPEKVEKYSNKGNRVSKVNEFENLSGLPVIYKNENPLDQHYGRSDVEDYKTILDSMELLLSKSNLGFYMNMFGIAVVKGQPLFTTEQEQIDPDLLGAGINVDSDGDFSFVSNQFDSQAFETLYSTLMTTLLDISQTPGVAMGKTDVSNLSEISLKIMYSAASLKAMILEKYIKESLKVRLEKIRMLLEYKGVKFTDTEWATLDIGFTYALPVSESDIIENLVKLKSINAISDETMLRMNPYVQDVSSELGKLDMQNPNAQKGNTDIENENIGE